VAAPVAFLAKPIISFIFGNAYLGAVSVLQIYIWSSISLFLGTVVGHQLMAENRTRSVFLLNFIAMIVNVVLNLVFIPKLGLIGAAVATLIAYTTIPLIMLFLPKKDNSDLVPKNLNLINS
jgi:O-antigen/teichoic acid export membrane protein